MSVSRRELDALLAAEVAKDAWIIDGNYSRTFPMRLALREAAVWLDLPRWQCLMGVLLRAAVYRHRTRADMAEGCAERLDIGFLKYIWNFNRQQRDGIAAMLEKTPPRRLFCVRRRRDLETVESEITEAFGE